MAERTFHSLTLPGQDTARVPLTAVEFNTSTAYKVKDYCTYQGKLYRCTVAHAAGAWNASHFTETDMDAELDRKLDIPPSQGSAPANPRVGDLWIDNDENSPIYNVDAAPTLGSTNAVQSGGTKTALNAIDSRKVEHGCITGDFSASVDYRVGDLVFYATTANGITTRTLYRCTTAHNAAAWNASHFTATTLEVELQRVRDNEADTDMIGDLFGAKTTYAVGDYCIYNDNLYRCIQAVDNTGVTTPAFDPDDWTQVALANDVSDLKSALNELKTVTNISFEVGQINTNVSIGNIVDITPSTGAGYDHVLCECKKDDVFTVSTRGGSSPRAWAFTDKTYHLINKSAAYVTIENEKLTTTVDGYLILNCSSTYTNPKCVKSSTITTADIESMLSTKVDKTGKNQVTKENADFVKNIIGFNKFNPAKATLGYTMNTNGTEIANSDRACSDFIKCHNETIFSATSGLVGAWCFYDENKDFIEYHGISGSRENLTIPNTAYYLRVSLNKTKVNEFGIYFKETAPFYIPYIEEWVLDGIKDNFGYFGKDPKLSIGNLLAKGGTIKFIGDSITQGVGGTGFAQDGDTICTISGTTWKVNTNGYCFANLFKSYIETKFPSVNVLNYGCRGFTSANLIAQLENIIKNTDDLVICMIGTNDRASSTVEDIENNITLIREYCLAKEIDFVLVSEPPTSISQDDQTIHIEDIDHIYDLIASKNNAVYISMYQKMLEYCENTGTPLNSLLSDGLHPNDDGYYVLYKILMRGLSLGYQLPGSSWDNATPS